MSLQTEAHDLLPPSKELSTSLKISEILVKKSSNRKEAGPDGVQGFRMKKLSSWHKLNTEQCNALMNGEEETSGWLAK